MSGKGRIAGGHERKDGQNDGNFQRERKIREGELKDAARIKDVLLAGIDAVDSCRREVAQISKRAEFALGVLDRLRDELVAGVNRLVSTKEKRGEQ